MFSPYRSLADVKPENAIFWSNFSTQFDVNGVRVCENLGRHPLAPRYATMGAGSGASVPSQLVGRHGLSFAGAQYVDTGIVDPFERTDRFTLACMYAATAANSDLISCGDDANFNKGIILQSQTQANSRFWVCNTYNTNLILGGTPTTYNERTVSSFVATYNGSSSLGGVKLYKSGVYVAPAGYDSLSATIKSGKSFLIGARHNGAAKNSFMTGTIRNAMIFPWELTPQQVQHLDRLCRNTINAA